MRRFLLGLATVALGTASFLVARAQGTVHLPAPPPHLPTAPADEDDVRWAARADIDVVERQNVALRVLAFLGHPDDADLLWRRSLDEGDNGALATSLLGRVSQQDPALRQRLLALANDPDAMHRTAAIEALGDLGTAGVQRLVAFGKEDGVVQGLARSRGANAASHMLAFSREGGEVSLIQRDFRSLELLEGTDRLEALALHDPSKARRRLEDRIADGKVDRTTRTMIQALPPHGPWLDRVAAADAPLADRARLLLHFDPAYQDTLLEELAQLDSPEPEAANLLHGPSVEAFRHAEAAADGEAMADIVGADWHPGQVPDELVTLVLASESLRNNWLQVPDFLAVAATDAAVDHLLDGASRSKFGTGWMGAIDQLPDPAGPVVLWEVVDANPSNIARNAALELLLERGPDHLERALAAFRADVGRGSPGISWETPKVLLERGTVEDEDAVLDLCVDGTHRECQEVIRTLRRWSVVARLVKIAEDANDTTRAVILTAALSQGHLDDQVHSWIGDADPAIAGAALARLPEVAGDDLTKNLIAELPYIDPIHHWQVVDTLRSRDPKAAAAAVRALDDPSAALTAFSGRQDPISRALRDEFAADERPEVRAVALRGMRLGSRDEEERCRSALADPVPEVRQAAASCVGFPQTTHAAKQLATAYRAHGHPEILEMLKTIGGPYADAFR